MSSRDATLLEIAQRELLFPTLTTRRSREDFREVAVWMVDQALAAAYDAGAAAERKRRGPRRCECPACGRSIEIRRLG